VFTVIAKANIVRWTAVIRSQIKAGVFIAAAAAAFPSLADPPPLSTHIEYVPLVGQEAEVEVGKAMVSAARMATREAILTQNTYEKSGLTIPAGRLTLVRETSQGRFYQVEGFVPHIVLGHQAPTDTGGIFVPFSQNIPAMIYWKASGSYVPVLYPVPGINFQKIVYDELDYPRYSQELIYTGVSKGSITLTYREFKGATVRPTSTQELHYDLADGDEIGYQGARFKIIKATNVSIRYVVVKPLAIE
jgi:hypothetical protein